MVQVPVTNCFCKNQNFLNKAENTQTKIKLLFFINVYLLQYFILKKTIKYKKDVFQKCLLRVTKLLIIQQLQSSSYIIKRKN